MHKRNNVTLRNDWRYKKGQPGAVNRGRTDNKMAKGERTKGQTMTYKTLRR